jgi:hypothetical protein
VVSNYPDLCIFILKGANVTNVTNVTNLSAQLKVVPELEDSDDRLTINAPKKNSTRIACYDLSNFAENLKINNSQFLQAATTGKKVESRARPQLKGAVLPAKVPLTPSLLAARGTVTPSLAARGTVTPSLAGRGTATPSLAARGAGGGTPALPPPSANVRAAASKTRRSLLVSSTPLRPPGDLSVA